ncbi:MAG: ClbS/DfsB family four-helix bundle protein [Chloroflexota bacterium]|nr:maleylpyruvate isomerase N-terminal domain-containing protein [Chloroflexota bacterium]MDE3103360.1 ClbS/DfsB family four-helix bundle protein [Chloroflexota bacterium]
MNKDELVRTITSGHRDLAELVDRISDDALRGRVTDDWTGKDVLAHIAWWHGHSVLVVEGLRAGQRPYDATDPANITDAVNERVLREHVDDAPQATRAAVERSFERLVESVAPLTDDDLFRTDRWPWLNGEALVETLLWDTSRHYTAHLDQLRALSR